MLLPVSLSSLILVLGSWKLYLKLLAVMPSGIVNSPGAFSARMPVPFPTALSTLAETDRLSTFCSFLGGGISAFFVSFSASVVLLTERMMAMARMARAVNMTHLKLLKRAEAVCFDDHGGKRIPIYFVPILHFPIQRPLVVGSSTPLATLV